MAYHTYRLSVLNQLYTIHIQVQTKTQLRFVKAYISLNICFNMSKWRNTVILLNISSKTCKNTYKSRHIKGFVRCDWGLIRFFSLQVLSRL